MKALLLALALSCGKQDDAAADEALVKFSQAFESKDPNARAAAVEDLAKTRHAKIVDRLGELLRHDMKLVRLAAVRGLRTVPQDLKKSAAGKLEGGLGNSVNRKEPEVQIAIFAALGELREESSLGTVHKFFDDPTFMVAEAAVKAAADIRSKKSIGVLVEFLKALEKEAKGPTPKPKDKFFKPEVLTPEELAKRARAASLIPGVNVALGTITRVGITNAAAWDEWWQKNRSTFKIP